jgi:putative membrane protein
MTRLTCLAAIAACSCMVACETPDRDRVNENTPIAGPTAATGQGLDAQFFQEAADANQAEVALARIAMTRASHPDVRRFAQMMIDEHGRAQNDLLELARIQGHSPQPTLTPDRQQLQDRLERLSGPEFDRAYIEAMVREHQRAITKFENQVRTGRDVQAKNYAADQLDHLRHHLENARDIQFRLDAPPGPGTLQDGGQLR